MKAFENKAENLNCDIHDLFLLGYIIKIFVMDYLSMMTSNGLFLLTTKPTRVTNYSSRLIDLIFTISKSVPVFSAVVQSYLKDHFPSYCTFSPTCDKKSEKHFSLLIRYMKNLKLIIICVN